MYILALIPARGGSKGIPQKNIKLFKGKPLIQYSIEHAKNSKYINRIIVSTDNNEISSIAKKCGAEVPFLRPSNISQDLSTDYEFFVHCLEFLKQTEQQIPDIIVQLRPTYPLRKLEILDDTINKFISNYQEYDSLRTVIPSEKSPYKMYTVKDDVLMPLFMNVGGLDEPYNLCRQELPQTYLHNGYIDIVKGSIILEQHTISGSKIYPYIMSPEEYHDIDTLDDWEDAEKQQS